MKQNLLISILSFITYLLPAQQSAIATGKIVGEVKRYDAIAIGAYDMEIHKRPNEGDTISDFYISPDPIKEFSDERVRRLGNLLFYTATENIPDGLDILSVGGFLNEYNLKNILASDSLKTRKYNYVISKASLGGGFAHSALLYKKDKFTPEWNKEIEFKIKGKVLSILWVYGKMLDSIPVNIFLNYAPKSYDEQVNKIINDTIVASQQRLLDEMNAAHFKKKYATPAGLQYILMSNLIRNKEEVEKNKYGNRKYPTIIEKVALSPAPIIDVCYSAMNNYFVPPPAEYGIVNYDKIFLSQSFYYETEKNYTPIKYYTHKHNEESLKKAYHTLKNAKDNKPLSLKDCGDIYPAYTVLVKPQIIK